MLEKILGFIGAFNRLSVVGFPLGVVVVLVVGIFGSKGKDGKRDWQVLLLGIIGAILLLVTIYGMYPLIMHFLK